MTDFITSVDTSVPVRRSIEQIRALVERFEAREFRLIYGDDSKVVAIRFAIRDPNVAGEPITVELRAPTDAIQNRLIGEAPTGWQSDAVRRRHAAKVANAVAQSERVAWRHLHDFIRASLIAVQDGLLTVGEAFFANLIVRGAAGEQRLAEAVFSRHLLRPANNVLLLASPTPESAP